MSDLKEDIIKEIKKIYDPEIPVNIYELGLIYDVKVNGDTAKILNNINAGSIVGFDDYKLIKDELLRFYNLYKAKKLNVNSSNFEIFSRKELASKFASIFNDMSNV